MHWTSLIAKKNQAISMKMEDLCKILGRLFVRELSSQSQRKTLTLACDSGRSVAGPVTCNCNLFVLFVNSNPQRGTYCILEFHHLHIFNPVLLGWGFAGKRWLMAPFENVVRRTSSALLDNNGRRRK